ncbi:hypothetical protein ACTXT7_014527 [Hymenolepis weldensis]
MRGTMKKYHKEVLTAVESGKGKVSYRALDYRILDSHVHTWICTTIRREAVAAINYLSNIQADVECFQIPVVIEEKERRIAQHKVYEAKRKETIEKIAARAFARVYIEPLIPNVYEQLHLNGYFSDSIQNGKLDLAIYISLKCPRQPHFLQGFLTLIMGREIAP